MTRRRTLERLVLPAPALVLPGLGLLLAACGAPPPPPAPPRLGYDAVGEPVAVYALGDTSRVSVDAGGETVDATVAAAMTLDMEFRPSAEGVTVSAAIRDFSARASNPLTPAQTADIASVGEPLVFELDRRGEPTLVSAPTVEDEAGRFLSPEATAATLFPRLPGRPVEVGDQWTDTMHVEGEQTDTRVSGSSVLSYTVVGDTLVDGRSLLRVTVEGVDHREMSGGEAGVELSQSVDGTSTGWFLWDLQRGLLHESVYESDLVGTMDLAEMPFPLSIRVRSRSVVRLVEVPPAG